MLKSKTDLNNNVELYKTFNNIYHRFGIDKYDTMLYLDNTYGEMIPFFNLKIQKKIFYNNISVKDVTKSELFQGKSLQSKLTEIVEDVDHSTSKFHLMYVNCNFRHASNYIRYLKLNGIILSTQEFEDFPGISKIGKFENVHVYRKLDDYFMIMPKNLFAGMKPVKNRFEVVKGSADVSVRIFAVSDRDVKIYGVRFDDITDFEVEVILYSMDGTKTEKIKMKLTSEIFTRINHACSFEVEGIETENDNQHIPKVICQTLNERVTRSMHYKTVMNLQMLNPEYEYQFYTSSQRRLFIKSHFDEAVLDTYDGLVSGAFKADLFRYCWLYKNGGVYIDCKMVGRAPLRDFLAPNEDLFLCEDRIPNAYQNCFIGSVAKQSDILNCIKECVARFEQKILRRVSFGSLYHTGPYLFYHCMKEHSTLASFRGPFNDLTYTKTGIYLKTSNQLLFNVWFKDYYKDYRSIHKRSIWSQEWAEGKIYYSKRFEIEGCPQYSIRVHPGKEIDEDNLKFFYKEGSHIYNNMYDKIVCQIIDEYQHIEQTIFVKNDPESP